MIGKPYEKSTPLIVVVDDDRSMREALQSLLKSVGFHTAIFASANEFLRADENSEADCLILDVRMPDVTGLELQHRLVSLNSRVPIVFISAHCESDEKERAIAAGAIDFLYKPFSEESLLSAVDRAIKSKRS